jgi:hypothetical protein
MNKQLSIRRQTKRTYIFFMVTSVQKYLSIDDVFRRVLLKGLSKGLYQNIRFTAEPDVLKDQVNPGKRPRMP